MRRFVISMAMSLLVVCRGGLINLLNIKWINDRGYKQPAGRPLTKNVGNLGFVVFPSLQRLPLNISSACRWLMPHNRRSLSAQPCSRRAEDHNWFLFVPSLFMPFWKVSMNLSFAFYAINEPYLASMPCFCTVIILPSITHPFKSIVAVVYILPAQCIPCSHSTQWNEVCFCRI